MKPHTVSMLINETMQRVRLDETADALRHSMATDVLRAGAHVRDMQAALGHANLATTQIYMPLVVNDLRGKPWAARRYRA